MCSIASTAQREETVKSNNILGQQDDKAAVKPNDLSLIPQDETSITQISKYNQKEPKKQQYYNTNHCGKERDRDDTEQFQNRYSNEI